MKATVILVSSNTNNFGYKSVMVLSEDGKAKQVLVQAYGTDTLPEKGDDINTEESKFHYGSEMPAILPSLAKQLIKKAKDEKIKTKT